MEWTDGTTLTASDLNLSTSLNSNAGSHIGGDMTVEGTLKVRGSHYLSTEPSYASEEDIFKKITTLLGIKIINVTIKGGHVVLYGRRNKKRFVIEINATRLTVANDKGKIITKIYLENEFSGIPSPNQVAPSSFPMSGGIGPAPVEKCDTSAKWYVRNG